MIANQSNSQYFKTTKINKTGKSGQGHRVKVTWTEAGHHCIN